MGPKRKSPATPTSAFYNFSEAASSKKRLITHASSDQTPISLQHNMSSLEHDQTSQPQSQPQNVSQQPTPQPVPSHASGAQSRPSPSLENIVTDFTRLSPSPSRTYLILGASRGIGLEFARQLLLQNHQVIAVVRNPQSASLLWQVTGQIINRPGSCIIEQCDISDPASIDAFVARMRLFLERGGSLDTIILNAGILEYAKGLGSLDVSFENLDRHLRVNCIGNIVLARNLLQLNDLEVVRRRREQRLTQNQSGSIGSQVVFMSSDSGSMADFREYEDGFAAYGASKVALNMMIRHMASELKRVAARKKAEARNDWQSVSKDGVEVWQDEVCVLAMHPGEVSTDMANVELAWDVEGMIEPKESVKCMLGVLGQRTVKDSGTFWRWDGTQHPW